MTNVCIVGLGHIGGSLGKALVDARKNGKRLYKVYGYARKPGVCRAALKIKACDAVFNSIDEIKNCDIIVLCVPVDKIAHFYKALVKIVSPETVITDVGSIKGFIEVEVKKIRGNLPHRKVADFVGAHPMAGREVSGINSADETIFKGATCIITGSVSANVKNEKLVKKMWQDTGLKIVKMPAKEHDFLTALTSHLPHITAFCLQGMYNDVKRKYPNIEKIVAGSFKSATRVATSSAAMWAPIFNLNRKEIIKHTEIFSKNIKKLSKVSKISNILRLQGK
ncbi:MAG: prephenate dehydrogenase/arogenate dehydrogenase family protein [Elusimicrobia bacterium]|nr:prephenate dehydrogenase/arogenate dehydrogenase family protein [Elusimicrobiota bacterium]